MATSLLVVYCLYLLFFQGYLINPFNETTKKFKKSFSHKVTLPKRNSAEVTDYSHLSKSDTESNRIFDFISGVFCSGKSGSTAGVPQAISQSKSPGHLPDDAYRLYLLCNAILI